MLKGKDSFIYLVGEIISKVSPFILLPILTRQLSQEDFAEYALNYSIFIILSCILCFYQTGSIARYYFRYGPRGENALILSGFIVSLLILIAIFSILHVSQSISLSISLVLLAAFFNSLFTVQLRVRQIRLYAKKYIAAQISSSLLILVTTLFFLALNVGPAAYFIAAAIVYSLAAIYLAINHHKNHLKHKRLTFKRTAGMTRYIVSLGVTGIIHQLCVISKGHLDRLFIGQAYTDDQLAIYASSIQLASTLSLVILALNRGLTPHIWFLLKNKKIEKHFFLKWSIASLLVVPIPAVISIALPEHFYQILLGESYARAKYYTTALLFSFGFSIPYTILISYLLYTGRNKSVGIISVATTALYATLLNIITSGYSMVYVPYASLIINIVTTFCFWIYVFCIKTGQGTSIE